MSSLAISQPDSPFEALPIEIHTLILHAMPSLQDLHATIQASPTALGAFLGSREAILLLVLERHIPPEIFCHYLALLGVPKYADFNFVAPFDPDWGYDETEPCECDEDEEMRWEAWRDLAYDFYKDAINTANHARSGGGIGEHHVRTLETRRMSTRAELEAFKNNIQYLVTMYRVVERFTKDFQAFSFNVAEGRPADQQKIEFSNPPDDATQWPALSASEQVRLHRGLLRYELCCRLFGAPFLLRVTDMLPKDPADYSPDEDDPFCIVEDLMPSWEMQEILAVRAYVQRKYDLLHLNVQKQFLVDIRSMDQKTCSSASGPTKAVGPKPCKESGCEECLSPVRAQWKQFATVVGGPTDWVECMSRLGLVALQCIMRSDPKSRPELYGNMFNWHIWRPDRCWVGRDDSGSHPGWIFPNDPQRRGQASVSLADANPVFRAAQIEKDKLNLAPSDERLENGTRRLQELGWVFWEDCSRISALRLPHHEDGQTGTMYQLADLLLFNDVHGDINYEVKGFLRQVEGYHVTNEDWHSIIVPKYGLSPLGLFRAAPRSKTPWLDVW